MSLRILALVSMLMASLAQAASTVYTVKPGDTLYRIARAQNLNPDALRAVNPGLRDIDALQVGQIIRLPVITRQATASAAATVRPASIRVRWSLPVQGVVTTPYYGTPEHAGIDLAAPAGTPIVVSRPGQVTESRFDDRTGWGWTVVIDFKDGSKARYSHNQMNLVRIGDTVQEGQVIARIGSTGNSTGPHVDYRVTVNGAPVNPLLLH